MDSFDVELRDVSRPAAKSLVRDAGIQHFRRHELTGLRWLLTHPAASDDLEDLLILACQYPEFRNEIGHRSGPQRVLELLADAYDHPEAILTLGIDLYESPRHGPRKFAEFLKRHRETGWLL